MLIITEESHGAKGAAVEKNHRQKKLYEDGYTESHDRQTETSNALWGKRGKVKSKKGPNLGYICLSRDKK